MIKLSFPRYVSLYPVLGLLGTCALKLTPSCNSTIYCTGELLHTVQLAKIFPDSKTFVDLKLLSSEEEVLTCFGRLMTSTKKSPNRVQLMTFLDQHFEDKEELDYWRPPDFQQNPPILNKIKNLNILLFAKDIINVWPALGRKVSTDVAWSAGQYSFIYVPKGFIVPGSRCKDLYYWDSYWIIRGLLFSNMFETAKGMIENFLYLVKRFGYIPNGSRIYNLGRNHPPLLAFMVADYFAATGDKKFLKYNLPVIEKELSYWLEKKKIIIRVNGIDYKFLRYSSDSYARGPRPEAYFEDYINANKLPNTMRETFFAEMKGAAESGWDFSSRWVREPEVNAQFDPTDIETSRIIPVDLNSFFAGALQKLGDLKSVVFNSVKAKRWWSLAKQWRYVIDKFMWNSEDGVWYDVDSRTMFHRKKFYLSCGVPLWAGAVENYHVQDRTRGFVSYLQYTGVLKFPGGVPTSLWETGEKWDFPNAFAPLQSMLIGGLEKSNYTYAKQLAKKLAKAWFRANHIGYMKSQKLFEKYSVLGAGEYGSAEEYEVQNGYGWTNGVLLELIHTYGNILL